MKRMMKRRASPRKILEQLKLAIEGKYAPRPDVDQTSVDKAHLVKIIGGPKLLYALQKCSGFLSESVVKRERPKKRFITSWNDHVYARTVESNLAAFCLSASVSFVRA
eukprot:449179-Prymnesium_polylepis.1